MGPPPPQLKIPQFGSQRPRDPQNRIPRVRFMKIRPGGRSGDLNRTDCTASVASLAQAVQLRPQLSCVGVPVFRPKRRKRDGDSQTAIASTLSAPRSKTPPHSPRQTASPAYCRDTHAGKSFGFAHVGPSTATMGIRGPCWQGQLEAITRFTPGPL